MRDREIPCPQCSDECEDARAICDFCGGQGYIFRSGEPWGGRKAPKAESAQSPLGRSDQEILNIMIQGAEQICDHALAQWTADRYQCGEEMRRNMINEWKITKKRVRQFVQEIQLKIWAGDNANTD